MIYHLWIINSRLKAKTTLNFFADAKFPLNSWLLTIQGDATSADGTTNPATNDQAITEKPSTSEAGFTNHALSWTNFSNFETYWLKNPHVPKIVILRNRDISSLHRLLVLDTPSRFFNPIFICSDSIYAIMRESLKS